MWMCTLYVREKRDATVYSEWDWRRRRWQPQRTREMERTLVCNDVRMRLMLRILTHYVKWSTSNNFIQCSSNLHCILILCLFVARMPGNIRRHTRTSYDAIRRIGNFSRISHRRRCTPRKGETTVKRRRKNEICNCIRSLKNAQPRRHRTRLMKKWRQSVHRHCCSYVSFFLLVFSARTRFSIVSFDPLLFLLNLFHFLFLSTSHRRPIHVIH